MPFSNRPYEVDRPHGGKSSVRGLPSFRRIRENGGNGKQRPAPPETTNAEAYYYLKQMNARTPMVVVLNDGEQIHGWIEWYDRNCLKVNREGAPNLLIQKHCIKYLFKEEDL